MSQSDENPQTTAPVEPTNSLSGSRFGNFVGMHTQFVSQDFGISALEIKDVHMNSLGIVHGGVILSFLDHACGAALTHGSGKAIGKAAFTVSLHAVFVSPARRGRLVAKGRCIKRGKSIAYCDAEIEDENGTLIAKATGAFKLVD